jgi:hypothetical protein
MNFRRAFQNSRNHHVSMLVVGGVGLLLLARALIPETTMKAHAPAAAITTPPVHTQRVVDLLASCDAATSLLGQRLSSPGGGSIVASYDAASRAEELCRSAYLSLSNLPSTPLTDTCKEAASVKRFAAERAQEVLNGPTPARMKALEDAVGDLPSASQACTAELERQRTTERMG